MLISVVICTFNRCDDLAELFQSFERLEGRDRLSYEILVVDNNSSDHTKESVLQQQQSWGPKLRYVFEKEQGLSRARNRGIREAEGDYVIFIDDDARVEPFWLRRVTEFIQQHSVDCFGGKIFLDWETRRPAWMNPELECCLSRVDHGDHPFRVRTSEHRLNGCNFGVKRTLFENEKYFFRTDLGRIGNCLYSGEETFLFLDLLADGHEIWYCPEAVVHHRIRGDRASFVYLLKWHFFHGRQPRFFDPEKKGPSRRKWSERAVHVFSKPVLILMYASFWAGRLTGWIFQDHKNDE